MAEAALRVARLEHRRAWLVAHAAKLSAGTNAGAPERARRVADFRRRVGAAVFHADWPEEDEAELDYLQDEGLYLDMETRRDLPPSPHLAGFLAAQIGALFCQGGVAPTWKDVDLLAAVVARMLQAGGPLA